MSSELQQIWRVNAPDRLSLREWDDGYVVYDDGPGDTHLIDLFTGRVLQQLLEANQSAAELAESLLTQVTGLSQEALQDAVTNSLRQLRTSGLVDIDSTNHRIGRPSGN